MADASDTAHSYMLRKALAALKADQHVRLLIEGHAQPIQVREITTEGITGVVALKGITTPPATWYVPARHILAVLVVEGQ